MGVLILTLVVCTDLNAFGPIQTSCSFNKFKAIYSIEHNFKVKCGVMSLILYFAIFQFFFFSKLYQHTNPSSCFRSFFLLRNACSTGVFCMLTSLLLLALSKFVSMLSWEKWTRGGWGPSPPPHNPILAPLLLLRTSFCLSPSRLWGRIQDGARLIKLRLLVKIHLQGRLMSKWLWNLY